MSVKLIPSEPSTGPAVNARNSTTNGRTRIHAATVSRVTAVAGARAAAYVVPPERSSR